MDDCMLGYIIRMLAWFGTAVFVLVTFLALDISTAAQEQIT